MEANGNQGAGSCIEQAMRSGDPDQAVTEVPPGRSDGENLCIPGRRAGDRVVAIGDLTLQFGQIQARLVSQRIHPVHQVAEVGRHDEVRAVLLEGFNRRRPGR